MGRVCILFNLDLKKRNGIGDQFPTSTFLGQ